MYRTLMLVAAGAAPLMAHPGHAPLEHGSSHFVAGHLALIVVLAVAVIGIGMFLRLRQVRRARRMLRR